MIEGAGDRHRQHQREKVINDDDRLYCRPGDRRRQFGTPPRGGNKPIGNALAPTKPGDRDRTFLVVRSHHAC